MDRKIEIPESVVDQILRYCEVNQTYDKLGAYDDFYYKLKKLKSNIVIPEGFEEIEINETVCESDLEGCFLFNHKWKNGGYFSCGGDSGFELSDGNHYTTFTGNSLYDQIEINGFKVYKKQ